jgi:hypothetical protein
VSSGTPHDGDGVPALLLERVREALGPDAAAPTPGACLDAGERMLARVLCADGGSRATAVDLLTADALVTWAFELAADAPAQLDALAGSAMRRIAATGATGD